MEGLPRVSNDLFIACHSHHIASRQPLLETEKVNDLLRARTFTRTDQRVHLCLGVSEAKAADQGGLVANTARNFLLRNFRKLRPPVPSSVDSFQRQAGIRSSTQRVSSGNDLDFFLRSSEPARIKSVKLLFKLHERFWGVLVEHVPSGLDQSRVWQTRVEFVCDCD